MTEDAQVSIGGNFHIQHIFPRGDRGLIAEAGLIEEMVWIAGAVEIIEPAMIEGSGSQRRDILK